jgi:hypothetical protein
MSCDPGRVLEAALLAAPGDAEHEHPTVDVVEHAPGAGEGVLQVVGVTGADFWARTLQNWQSEFLAVGAMAVFSIYLRQRGSSQSKPVGEPHGATGIDG